MEEQFLRRTQELLRSGVQMICLLALSDKGTPCYDEGLASKMSALGAPAFACTPDLFPDLMSHAIQFSPHCMRGYSLPSLAGLWATAAARHVRVFSNGVIAAWGRAYFPAH